MESAKECRIYLKNKLTGSNLQYYNNERSRLQNIVERNVEFGESDSVIIIGSRGCGKITMVNSVLDEIEKNSRLKGNFLLVRLHGLIHTDDNIAFRDIVRQINADTLSGEIVSGTSSDLLSFTLQCLCENHGDKTKSVIFVLEEFQCFCSHKNQTLLYNLYNIAQSEQVSVCVIGVTTKFDITELFEKRVKSRFSHNKIILLPKINFKERLDDFCSVLTLTKMSSSSPVFIRRWNKNIKYLSTEQTVIDILKQQFAVSKSQRSFYNTLLVAISSLDKNHPLLTVEDIENAFKLCAITTHHNPLQSLSVLELCLVVSIYHHIEVYDKAPFQFETIYQRYAKFAERAPSIIVVERSLAMKAFELLEILGLISKVDNKSSNKLTISYEFLMTCQEVKDNLRNLKDLPTDLMKWAGSSIEVI